MKVSSKLQELARRVKSDGMTVYFAARDPRTPLFVRILAFAVAAYAFSPIDLIPDFIPVLGYLDDLIILPLGIVLVVKLTPAEVIEASRSKAQELADKPTCNLAAAIIIAMWILCAAGLGYLVMDRL